MSIGIISEENPKFAVLSNIKLKDYLNSKNYCFEESVGKYEGISERVFIVKDITKEKLLELGRRYGQESVIVLDKTQNELLLTNSKQPILLEKSLLKKIGPNVNNYVELPYYGYLVLIFSMIPGESCGR